MLTRGLEMNHLTIEGPEQHRSPALPSQEMPLIRPRRLADGIQ